MKFIIFFHGIFVADDEVVGIALVEELREEVEVGDEGRLQDDRHVRRVEELDRVCTRSTSVLLVFHRKLDSESLKVDHDKKHKGGSHEIRNVWKILTVESFLESSNLVRSRDKKMKKCNDRALELRSSSRRGPAARAASGNHCDRGA